MIETRRATPSDAGALAALAREGHAVHAAALPDLFQPAEAFGVTADDLARLVARPGHVVLVAARAGAVVGYAHAEAQETPASPYKRAAAVLHVHAMAVAAAERGGGVGRALMEAVHAEAAARGLSRVSLEVYAFNDGARAFYAREGFVPLRELLVAPTRGIQG